MGFLIDNMHTFGVNFKFYPVSIYQKSLFLLKNAPNLDTESGLYWFIRANKI